MKAIEQILRVGVAIEVDVLKRMAVARQELLDAQRAGAVRRANQDDVAKAAGDQLDAAEDERPHEDVAQLGVGLHECEQLFAIELDHLAGLADRVRASARRPVSMLPSPVNCPARCVTISVSVPADGRRTCISPLTTTKNGTTLAHLDEHVAGRDRAPSSMGGDPFDLRRRERRKETLGARDGRKRGVSEELGASIDNHPDTNRVRSENLPNDGEPGHRSATLRCRL